MALTRLQRLGKRQIYAFYVDDVLARLTKAQSTNALAKAAAIPVARAGAAMLIGIKSRVTQRGQLGDGNMFPGYKKRGRITISQQYAQEAGANRETFKNEDEFHKRLKSRVGGYVVTGGMWRGAEVRTSGRNLIMEFVGKSTGRGKRTSKDVTYTTKTGKQGRRKKQYATPSQTDNRYKAGRIWQQHNVNVLSPRRQELVLLAQWAGLTQQQRQLAAVKGLPYEPENFTSAQRAKLAQLIEG